ncbi:MAG: TonB family protein, partial [Vicinamibacteria bacterium]
NDGDRLQRDNGNKYRDVRALLVVVNNLGVLLLSGFLASAQQQGNALEEGIHLYWNGEYERTIEVLSSESSTDMGGGERVELLRYLALSHIALGDHIEAQAQFIRLLTIDPGYRLDPSLVSPKVIDLFEKSKKDRIGELFAQGKASYYGMQYEEAIETMNEILLMDPQYQLAEEYRQLSAEQISLGEKAATIETGARAPAEESETVEEPEDKIYYVTSEIDPPVLVARTNPEYPFLDRQVRLKGTVVLAIVIERDGAIGEVRVVRSLNERMDEAALSAVKKWRYKPAVLKGQPVAVHAVVRVNFDLDQP